MKSMLSARILILALSGVALAPWAQAQQVYRIVGADGRITFSDQPPQAAANSRTQADSSRYGLGTGGGAAALPFELRQVASRYPVTLYTSENCGPCGSARTFLSGRGVPYTEKTVTSEADAQALQRMSGDNSLPFATIGSHQLKGFSDSEWTQFINAAGYPAASVLPANYRQQAATPLVAAATPPATTSTSAGSTPPTPRAAAPVVQPQATNPAGIRF